MHGQEDMPWVVFAFTFAPVKIAGAHGDPGDTVKNVTCPHERYQ